MHGRRAEIDLVCRMMKSLTRYGSGAQDVYVRGSVVIACCLNRISPYSHTDVPVILGTDETTVLAADAVTYNRGEFIQEYRLGGESISNNELPLAAHRKWTEGEGTSHSAGLLELFASGCWQYYLKEAAYLSQGSISRFARIVFPAWFRRNLSCISAFLLKSTWCRVDYKSELNWPPGWARIMVYSTFPPLLDHTVVDFARGIPRHLFFKNGINRYIFRRAFEGSCPKTCVIISQRTISRVVHIFIGKRRSKISNRHPSRTSIQACMQNTSISAERKTS